MNLHILCLFREMDERVAIATTKMEEAVSKTGVLQSGILINQKGCGYFIIYNIALDSTQLELFELKNRLDDDSSAR